MDCYIKKLLYKKQTKNVAKPYDTRYLDDKKC